MKKLPLSLAVACALGILPLTGCPALDTGTRQEQKGDDAGGDRQKDAQDSGALQPGSAISEAQLNGLFPAITLGMTWTYQTTWPSTRTIVDEVTAMSGTLATLTRTDFGTKNPRSFQHNAWAKDYWFLNDDWLRLKYEGKEDVTVTAGTFAGAAKLGKYDSSGKAIEYTYVDKTVGIVKREMLSDGKATMFLELQSFTAGSNEETSGGDTPSDGGKASNAGSSWSDDKGQTFDLTLTNVYETTVLSPSTLTQARISTQFSSPRVYSILLFTPEVGQLLSIDVKGSTIFDTTVGRVMTFSKDGATGCSLHVSQVTGSQAKYWVANEGTFTVKALEGEFVILEAKAKLKEDVNGNPTMGTFNLAFTLKVKRPV